MQGESHRHPELTSKGKPKTKRVRTVTGCVVCRQRKVKCDERRPRCTPCSRHPGRVCQYWYEAVSQPAMSTALSTLTSTSTPSSSSAGSSVLDVVSALDVAGIDRSFGAASRAGTATIASTGAMIVSSTSRAIANDSTLTKSGVPPNSLSFKADASNPYAISLGTSSSSFSSAPASAAAASASSSSSAVTRHQSKVSNEPYLMPKYQDVFLERMVMGLLENEYRTLGVLNPYGSRSDLADTLISKIPFAVSSPLRTLLPYHAVLVRRCFEDLSHDREAFLLCSTMALFSTGRFDSSSNRIGSREDIFQDYIRQVEGKVVDEAVTGKLAATGFTLFLSQILSPTPGRWKEQLRVGVDWSIERGGPGWIIGVSPPLPGYRGGTLQNHQPLAMAMYLDFTAIVVLLASLSDGKLPLYVNGEQHSWLLASRALQVKLSPSMPDLFEAILGVPRIMIPAFARAVGLVSRRLAVDQQPEMLKEQLEFEAVLLRLEMEHAWPSRLDMRLDHRRLQYGARIWRLAILILLIQKVQLFSTEAPELSSKVEMVLELCSEAAADLGHLTGWLWPILISACAAANHSVRDRFRALLPLAKSPISDRDSAEVANKILSLVYVHHDIGMQTYHINEATHDDPSLDVLLL